MTHNTKHVALILGLFLLSFVIVPHVAKADIWDTLIGVNKDCNFVKDGLYKPFSDIDSSFPAFGKLVGTKKAGCVDVSGKAPDLVQSGFVIFLSVITLIAVFQISAAGIKWMTSEGSSGGKSAAKQQLTNSIIGLVLAFSAWLILYTVNPRLLQLDVLNLKTNSLAVLINKGIQNSQNITAISGGSGRSGTSGSGSGSGSGLSGDGSSVNGAADGSGTVGDSNFQGTSQAKEVIDSGQSGSRSQDGGLNMSLYASKGDSTTDSNTAAGIGNHDNQLKDGDVALSPDLIKRYGVVPGQQVFVNDKYVGTFNDTTGDNTDPINKTGTPIVNTIDVYNPSGAYGNTNNTLKVIPAGTYKLTFGPKP